ncbi:hypothetical protein YC2023_081388 [Brassica napus]
MEEDSVRRLPRSFLAHYILEDFGRLMGSLLGSLLKYNALEDFSEVCFGYEKPAYQKKMFKWLKNREKETQKIHIQVKDENHLVKNLQQKDRLVRKT